MISNQLSVSSYLYDDANRLTSVNGAPYDWDDNGNLLSDGTNTYTYDSANRLTSISGGSSATFTYNGLGDRLSQNGVNYTLDLNTGLTQILDDGTNSYVYGNGRIAQVNTTTEYFLGDALGSVRQLTDASGTVTLAKSYDPYGTVSQSVGSGASVYAYTGEQQDASGLTYLRARYYSSGNGRFLTRDTWMGDYNRPLSLHRWLYVEGNPVNRVDPSGHISCKDSTDPICVEKVQKLKTVGLAIKTAVTVGGLYPVEGFAQYVDFALPLFDNDLRGAMWAITLTIEGMDANQGIVAFQHSVPYRDNWLQFDWLPYQNNFLYNVPGWYGNMDWIHSRRGDWSIRYWDKTANQAFHFWYFVAVSFFDTPGLAEIANFAHETGVEELAFFPEWTPPPSSGKTQQDWDLSYAGISLGRKLHADYEQNVLQQIGCPDWTGLINHIYTKPGAWIRANLKGPTF